MSTMTDTITKEINVESQNKDIELFSQVHPITTDMKRTQEGVSRLVMLDRYAFKDTEKKTLKAGDFVVLTVKSDPKFPARGFGFVRSIDWDNKEAIIAVANEFTSLLESEDEIETGEVRRSLNVIDKPLEIYYEQIAMRNATGLASVEETDAKKQASYNM